MLEQKRSNEAMNLSADKNLTGSSALQLWLAYPGDLAEPAIEKACAAILDDAERERELHGLLQLRERRASALAS